MADEQTTPRRRWRPRFSLLALLLAVVFIAACGGLWWRWEPWVIELHWKAHKDSLRRVSWSPNGTHIVTAVHDGTAAVWHAPSGRKVFTFKGNSGWPYGFKFSPEGDRVLSSCQKTSACIWESATGKTLVEFKGHTSYVNSAEFSSDGERVVTGADDGTARVWDAATGRQLVILKLAPPSIGVWFACFSPDSRRVLGPEKGRGVVHVWDSSNGQLLSRLEADPYSLRGVVFSSDGKQVISLASGRVRIWNASTGQPVSEVSIDERATDAQTRAIRSNPILAVPSPDRKTIFLSSSLQRKTLLKDTASDEVIANLSGDIRIANSASFSQDGQRLVTSNSRGEVHICDPVTGRLLSRLPRLSFYERVEFSPDGRRVIAGGHDGGVTVWFKRREESNWLGVELPEFWIALLSGIVLAAIAVRRFRLRKSP